MKPVSKTLAAAAVIVALAAPLGLTGCSSQDARQTTMVTKNAGEESTSTLTPTQRGEVRREALTAARAGMAAWKANDVDKMRSYFATQYTNYYTKLYAKYAKKGEVRVRKYVDVFPMDVSDMNGKGTQVLVDWQFKDYSYFTNKSGKVLRKAPGETTTIQLTMDKTKGKWQIVRMFGEGGVLD